MVVVGTGTVVVGRVVVVRGVVVVGLVVVVGATVVVVVTGVVAGTVVVVVGWGDGDGDGPGAGVGPHAASMTTPMTGKSPSEAKTFRFMAVKGPSLGATPARPS